MTEVANFEPDWVSPPGASIRDALVSCQLSEDEFASEAGLTPRDVERLLSGEMPIDSELAEALARTVGGSAAFWLRRDGLYRHRLPRQHKHAEPEEAELFVSQLPLKDMKAFGWLSSFSHMPTKQAALSFFTSTGGDWRSHGLRLTDAVAFRTSFVHQTNPASVAAWLMQGAIEAQGVECGQWDPHALRAALPDLRRLTRTKDPKEFLPRLRDICAACGVAVVFVQTPKGCPASGATHFSSKQKAIIQLSFRYRTDDHFWFTFFHEVGHLLLHEGSALFVEGGDYIDTEQEEEANIFSSQILLPPPFSDCLQELKDFKSVMRFARKAGVSAGIVIGQMQHRGFLRHDQMNYLKARYKWAEVRQAIL